MKGKDHYIELLADPAENRGECAIGMFRRPQSQMLDDKTLTSLINCSKEAMRKAHVPVSAFPVGAAVLTDSGAIYQGCNTESIIAGLGICAERSAVDHAVIHGEKRFLAVMVTSSRVEPLYPCGMCRQYLYEFAQVSGLDTEVYVLGSCGRMERVALSQLLNHGFGPFDK
jgi:cytidine deaminase